jgi:hypothetical protein
MPIDPVTVLAILAKIIVIQNRMPIDISEVILILLVGLIAICIALVTVGWVVVSLLKRRKNGA